MRINYLVVHKGRYMNVQMNTHYSNSIKKNSITIDAEGFMFYDEYIHNDNCITYKK